MQVCNESFHHVGKSLIRTLGIDDHRVFGDVVNIQVLHRRDFDVRRIHLGRFCCTMLAGIWEGSEV